VLINAISQATVAHASGISVLFLIQVAMKTAFYSSYNPFGYVVALMFHAAKFYRLFGQLTNAGYCT
jgi:hypothetical protein